MNTSVDERAIECPVCDDSGFERLECTGDRACGRRRRHLPHVYVVPCACRPVNRNYQERVERSRRRVA